MKKFYLLLIFTILLLGCNENIGPHVITFNKEIGIEITTYPKLEYFVDEDISFEGLEVSVVFENNDKKTIKNYILNYDDFKLGDNEVEITYKEFSTSFIIRIIKKIPLKIQEHSNYKELMQCNINYNDYTLQYKDVKYGVTRGKNMFIVFDEYNPVNTNIYGYEALVDQYGRVLEKNVNVSLRENCYVLSAHGTRIQEIKNLNIGDYVIYLNNTLYIYNNINISPYYELFDMFYKYLDYINTIPNIDLYNQYVIKVNEVIPMLESLFNGENDNININYIKEKLIIENNDNIFNQTISYSYCDKEYEIISNLTTNYNYMLSSIYEGKYNVGGFRNSDSIVKYDVNNYRERNSFGYEVAVNKDGIVIAKDVLVDLPTDGYILSGHTLGANFIINNIELNDKIVIKDKKIYVYSDELFSKKEKLINKRNQLVTLINNDKINQIPHDYLYIDYVMNNIDNIIDKILNNDYDIISIINNINDYKLLEKYYSIIEAMLIEYNSNNTQGIWYYPFHNNKIYDDTSYDGVINTLDQFKKMGINEIIIYPFKNGFCLFESNIFEKYSELDNYDYGIYEHDYLLCFIEEAHKRNICVNAFTQTFSEHIGTMKNGSEEYYQINFQGEKSEGSIYYYDICNDNIQKQLIEWYKELVTLYNFDKVEYDIIRYPSSNLYNYLDIDIIPDNVTIVDHGYTEYSMDKFMKLYNLSGDLRQLIKNDKNVRKNWLLFKEQNLIDFITNCTNDMKKINSDLVVTAAVMNDLESAKKTYLQDYEKWLKLNIIDEIDVMCYTFSCSQLEKEIKALQFLMDDYNVRIGISPRLDNKDLHIDIKQISMCTKFDGFILFANTLYYDELLVDILNTSMIDKKYSYLNSIEERNNGEIEDAILMIENYYSIIANNSYENLINSLKNKTNYIEQINLLENKKMKEYLLYKLN